MLVFEKIKKSSTWRYITSKSSLKFGFSLLLLFFTLKTTKFDLRGLIDALSNPLLTSCFLLLTFAQLFLASLRTELLMQFKEKKYHLKKILAANWASSFVAYFSPVGIVGDLFRISKLIEIDRKTSPDNSFYCAFFSKFFSTFSLVTLTAITIFYSDNIPYKLKVAAVSLLILLVLGLLLLKVCKRERIVDFFMFKRAKHTFWVKRIAILKNYLDHLLNDSFLIAKIFTYSFLVQILNCLSFILIISSLNQNVNYFQIFFLIPIGIFIMSLPISYSGLGVGNLAFSKLLAFYDIPNGSEVFSIFFILSFIFNALGVFPLILSLRLWPLSKHE